MQAELKTGREPPVHRGNAWMRAGYAPIVIGCAAVASAVFLLFYAPAWAPLGRDDGVFAYVGHELLEGAAPYRAVWDHKPPGIYLADALGLLLSGGGRWGIWALSAGVAVLSIVIAGAVLCAAFGPVWGALGTVVHAVILIDPKLYQENGNVTELYAVACQWLTLWLVTGVPHRRRDPFLAGLATGTAVAFKPTTSAIGLAALIEALRRRNWTGAVMMLCGAAVVPIAMIVWLGLIGVLADARDCVVTYNRFYVAPNTLGAIGRALYECVKKPPIEVLGVLTAASLVVPWAWRRPGPSAVRVARLALPLEIIWLGLSGRLYGHYFLTVLPVFTVCAVSFLAGAAERFPSIRRYRAVVALALVGFCLVRFETHVRKEQRRRPTDQLWQDAAVAAVRAHSALGDTILVWGAEMAINFLADRRAPSRYGYAFPFFTPGYASATMWRDFLSDLRREPPAVIVDASARVDWPTPVSSLREISAGQSTAVPAEAAAGIRDFLRSYRTITLPPGVELWVRQPAS